MDKKQYNNVIDYTLKHDKSAQTDDSLATARAIFTNMGVALPQGDIKEVFEVIKSGAYMSWRPCSMKEAQAAADQGIAAIGISDKRILVLSANDEEQPITKTTSVMSISENTSALEVDGLNYFSYGRGRCGGGNCGGNCGNETLVLDKPYDPSYPYENHFANSQAYYNYLATYSYELRNDIVYEFSFEEFNKFRAHISLMNYERSSQQQARQYFTDIVNVVVDLASYIPKIGLIFGLLNTATSINSLGNSTVQNDLHNIKECVDAFSYCMGSDNRVHKKAYHTYKVSLLMQSPNYGRQIKIECSDGSKELYTIQNAAYDAAQLAASTYAHDIKIYKTAPGWSYYWE